MNDPEYYEEMDRRLKASGLKHFTKSDENTSNDDQNVVQKTNRVQSPVAGVSRKKTSNSNRVKLTADDLASAKKQTSEFLQHIPTSGPSIRLIPRPMSSCGPGDVTGVESSERLMS